MAALRDQRRQQRHVVDRHEQQPQADRDPRGGRAFLHRGRGQQPQRQEHRTQQDRGARHGSEGLPALGPVLPDDEAGGEGEADNGGEPHDAKLAEELARDHLPARQRMAEQQQQRPALGLARDGVVRDQQRDQGDEEDRQARQPHHHDVQRAGRGRTGRGRAKRRDGRGERRHQQGGRDDPAVAKALGQFAAGDGQDGRGRHGAAGRGGHGEGCRLGGHAASRRRKCA